MRWLPCKESLSRLSGHHAIFIAHQFGYPASLKQLIVGLQGHYRRVVQKPPLAQLNWITRLFYRSETIHPGYDFTSLSSYNKINKVKLILTSRFGRLAPSACSRSPARTKTAYIQALLFVDKGETYPTESTSLHLL